MWIIFMFIDISNLQHVSHSLHCRPLCIDYFSRSTFNIIYHPVDIIKEFFVHHYVVFIFHLYQNAHNSNNLWNHDILYCIWNICYLWRDNRSEVKLFFLFRNTIFFHISDSFLYRLIFYLHVYFCILIKNFILKFRYDSRYAIFFMCLDTRYPIQAASRIKLKICNRFSFITLIRSTIYNDSFIQYNL